MADAQEKTEKPTGKKLGDARKRGQVPKSAELNSVAVLFATSFAALLSGPIILGNFKELLQELWGEGFRSTFESALGPELSLRLAMRLFAMISPVLFTALLIGVAVNVFQTKGLLVSWQAIKPSLGKLNPLQGFKRLFSTRSLVELIKSIIKICIIGYAIYGVMSSEYQLLIDAMGKEISEIAATCAHMGFKIVVRVCAIMLALSILDSYYQRWHYMKELKMTKQEVKEEHKQSEGSPVIKSRIRSTQRALARKRMLANVPKATVVVTNPTHYAVAILYNSEMQAPKVVAKGVDFLAKTIIKIARKHGVPVTQNPPLARALYQQVKVDDTIPVDLYKAVAKVLAYIYQQKRGRG